MKKKKEDENNDLRFDPYSLSAFGQPNIFSAGAALSPHSLEIANQLVIMPISTVADQTNYLLKTPSFTNSILADTTLASLGTSSINPMMNAGVWTVGTASSGLAAHFTTQSGTVPLYSGAATHSALWNPNDQYVGGATTIYGGTDISSVMTTGLAVEAVSGMISLHQGTQFQRLSLTGFDNASAVSSAKSDSIFLTSAFQQSFQSLKTDFVINHKSALEERVVLAMESMVVEKKKENTLKERELDIREREIKTEEEKNGSLFTLVSELRETMLRAFPPQQLSLTEELAPARFSFDKKTYILTNLSSGKTTQKISGQPLRLLECFLGNGNYTCKRSVVMKAMGHNKDAHSSAASKLNLLLGGVARIVGIRKKDSNREVDSYRLLGE